MSEPEKLEVTIKKEEEDPDSELEKLRKELEDKTTEAEDYRNKLALIAEQKLKEKCEAVDAPPEIDTPEKLIAFMRGKGLEVADKKGAAGTIPLSSTQTNDDNDTPQDTEALIKDVKTSVKNMQFDSYEQMVQVLKARETTDSEAKKLLNKLMGKHGGQRGEWQLESKLTEKPKWKKKGEK